MTGPGAGPKRGRLWPLLSGVAAVCMVAYPMAVYLGLTRWSLRGVALVLLALLAPVALRRLWRGGRPKWGDVGTLALLPVLTAALIGLSAALDRVGAVMLVPVAIHAVLLSVFAPSLWSERPMIERFARLQHADLSPAEVAWCRRWTRIWCGFFAFNIALNAALGALGALGAWTLYNGLLAYILMGVLFSVEWVLRKRRFGRPGDGLADRLFARFLSARPPLDGARSGGGAGDRPASEP